jgi:hypothetical protein
MQEIQDVLKMFKFIKKSKFTPLHACLGTEERRRLAPNHS